MPLPDCLTRDACVDALTRLLQHAPAACLNQSDAMDRHILIERIYKANLQIIQSISSVYPDVRFDVRYGMADWCIIIQYSAPPLIPRWTTVCGEEDSKIPTILNMGNIMSASALESPWPGDGY